MTECDSCSVSMSFHAEGLAVWRGDELSIFLEWRWLGPFSLVRQRPLSFLIESIGG
jgi:hypothetical protein